MKKKTYEISIKIEAKKSRKFRYRVRFRNVNQEYRRSSWLEPIVFQGPEAGGPGSGVEKKTILKQEYLGERDPLQLKKNYEKLFFFAKEESQLGYIHFYSTKYLYTQNWQKLIKWIIA